MINRLIELPKPKVNKNLPVLYTGDYTISDYAQAFISGLSPAQKTRFKEMLKNKIECGMSVAQSYGIDYKEFIKEVKKQLGVE